MDELADKVEAYNLTIDNGHGTEVLEQVVTYLRRGEHEQAVFKCTLDSDKLTQYDGCLTFLADCGLLSHSMTAFVRNYETKYGRKK